MLRLGVEYNFVLLIAIKVRDVCRYMFHLMMITVDHFFSTNAKKSES